MLTKKVVIDEIEVVGPVAELEEYTRAGESMYNTVYRLPDESLKVYIEESSYAPGGWSGWDRYPTTLEGFAELGYRLL